MRNGKRLLTVALLLAALLFGLAVVAALALPAGPSAAAAPPDLSWLVIAAGGATMSSANYLMLSTAGQPVSGTAASGNYSLLSGYWYGFQDFVRTILLPAIMGG